MRSSIYAVVSIVSIFAVSPALALPAVCKIQQRKDANTDTVTRVYAHPRAARPVTFDGRDLAGQQAPWMVPRHVRVGYLWQCLAPGVKGCDGHPMDDGSGMCGGIPCLVSANLDGSYTVAAGLEEIVLHFENSETAGPIDHHEGVVYLCSGPWNAANRTCNNTDKKVAVSMAVQSSNPFLLSPGSCSTGDGSGTF